jgi:hypothetical protein
MPQRIPKGGRVGVGFGLHSGPSFVRRLFSSMAGGQHSESPSYGSDAVAAVQSGAQRAVPAAFEQLEDRVFLSTYYVSVGGADSNAGSLAKPFRTIQRAANLAQPGDTVFVRQGTYRETVRPMRSGTGSSPIQFKAYGNEKVTVSGADVVSGWSKNSGSVYKARMGWDMGTGENQVFVDGQMMTEARWPNTSLDVSHPATASVDRMSGSTLYDASLGSGWDGAIIHMVPGQSWFGQVGKVTSSANGRINVSYSRMSGKEGLTSGDPYYLVGKFKALDAPTEWYRDPSGTLYLWDKNSDDPDNHTVEAKHRDWAFDLRGRSNIVVDGFNVFAASITSGSSNGLKLNDLNVKYPGHFIGSSGREQRNDSGVYLNGSNNSITNSEIAYGAGYGVFMYGSNNRAENNLIHDVDYSGGSSAGIRAYGSGALIKSNTIYNVGREGIKIAGATRSKIIYNVVHDAMLQTNDGGGIYTFGTNGGGTEIAYNRVYNVKSGGWGAGGLMLDNNSTNYVVHHNLVWNVNFGLKMNYGGKSNKIYNNTLAATNYSIDTASSPNFSGSVIKNNIFTKPLKATAGASVSNNITAGTDARFVDPSRNNFQLKAGSPAINKGTNLSPYTNGFTGSAPDIGALEFGRAAFGAGANVSVGSDWIPDLGGGEDPAVDPDPAPTPDPDPTPDNGGGGTKTDPDPTPTPTPTAGGLTLQAEQFDGSKGVFKSPTNVGSLDSGDWIRFDDVDFGSGMTEVELRLALPSRAKGKKIELHEGSAWGALLGTVTTTGTGDWDVFGTKKGSIKKTSGVHDLYVVFKGGDGVAVVDSIKFS